MKTQTTLRKASRLTVLALFSATLIAAPLAQTSYAADTTSTVTLRIDVGGSTKEVVIELDETNAPRTCSNFKKLAGQGYYDGIAFHRVISNYIVQAGDPLTKDASQKHLWGTGGPGYTLQAELGLPHERGSIAMARLGDAVNPNKASSGSQFYIALKRLPKLDREYTVFGKVISGLEILDQIASAPTDSNNNPGSRVEIVAASVTGGVVPKVAAAAIPAPVKTSAPAPAGTPPATKPKPAKKAAAVEEKKEAAPALAAAEPKPKKQSWLKRTFGRKKKDKEVAEVEQPVPAPEKAKSSPKPAATVASNVDDGGNNGEPTYRNDNRSDARSAAPAQSVASSSDAPGSLAGEMRTAAPEGDVDAADTIERGLIGRFLHRYW